MPIKDHQLSETFCPRCYHLLDAAAGTTDEPPKPGDLSVCLCCGSVNVFTDQMTFERAPHHIITLEAMMISLIYFKPIVEGDGKVH